MWHNTHVIFFHRRPNLFFDFIWKKCPMPWFGWYIIIKSELRSICFKPPKCGCFVSLVINVSIAPRYIHRKARLVCRPPRPGSAVGYTPILVRPPEGPLCLVGPICIINVQKKSNLCSFGHHIHEALCCIGPE